VELSFNLTNTGQMAGDEVVQCYVHDEIARFARPIKELKNFQRIHLNVGESKDVRIKLTADQLSYPDEAMNDLVEEGSFRIMIGSSSKDIRLRTLIEYIHE
jgi:beta-glucosidase